MKRTSFNNRFLVLGQNCIVKNTLSAFRTFLSSQKRTTINVQGQNKTGVEGMLTIFIGEKTQPHKKNNKIIPF